MGFTGRRKHFHVDLIKTADHSEPGPHADAGYGVQCGRGNYGLQRCVRRAADSDQVAHDNIIHGKKLVGILTEMSTQIDYINHVTVGVGINVNLTDFPEEIREHATSLRLECGHKVKRAPLIAAIMKRLEENYALFMETGDLSQLMEKYSELLVNKDRDVMILGAKEQYVAHALGINKTGELIVRKEDGTIEEVYAGEVSVRGVYGYV